MKLYKLLQIIFLIFISNCLWANSVNIEINPNPPVVNEEFQLIFKVTTSKNVSEPYITFNSGIAKVNGKRMAGKQSSARLVNGKFSTSVTYTIVYNLVSPRAMVFHISDIEVDIGGEIIKVPRKAVNVGVTRAQPKQFFLRAEVSKENVYIGEGIDLNYYLYSKVQNVGRTEIETFPKLNNFIKRFYMPKNQRQVVQVDGVPYRRSLEYSARIFPEKSGVLKIDPLKLKFPYTDYKKNKRGFGAFGFSFGRPVVKSLSSPVVKINVAEIPTAGMPSTFTGLVGDHDFEITVYKNKFLVNEAIEVRLEVRGPGALENYPAPILYQHPELEQFDTKSEVSELNKVLGKKAFDYTYLARNALNFKTRDLELSIFDPETKTFKTKTLKLPPVIVGGSEIDAKSSDDNTTSSSNVSESSSEQDNKPKVQSYVVLAPSFETYNNSSSSRWIEYFNYLFMVLVVLVILDMLRVKILTRKIPPEALELTKQIQKEGINYSKLNRYLRLVPKYSDHVPSKVTLVDIVESSHVSDACKKYFTDNIQIAENVEYNDNTNKYDKKFVRKYFDEINVSMSRK